MGAWSQNFTCSSAYGGKSPGHEVTRCGTSWGWLVSTSQGWSGTLLPFLPKATLLSFFQGERRKCQVSKPFPITRHSHPSHQDLLDSVFTKGEGVNSSQVTDLVTHMGTHMSAMVHSFSANHLLTSQHLGNVLETLEQT